MFVIKLREYILEENTSTPVGHKKTRNDKKLKKNLISLAFYLLFDILNQINQRCASRAALNRGSKN